MLPMWMFTAWFFVSLIYIFLNVIYLDYHFTHLVLNCNEFSLGYFCFLTEYVALFFIKGSMWFPLIFFWSFNRAFYSYLFLLSFPITFLFVLFFNISLPLPLPLVLFLSLSLLMLKWDRIFLLSRWFGCYRFYLLPTFV